MMRTPTASPRPLRQYFARPGVVLAVALVPLLWLGPALLLRAQEPLPGLPGEEVTLPDEVFPGMIPPAPGQEAPYDDAPAPGDAISAAAAGAPAAEDPAITRLQAQEEFLLHYSVSNPSSRVDINSARSTGDRLFDGFGGIARPSFSDLLAPVHGGAFELHVGPVKVRPSIGAGVSVSHISGAGARTQTEFNTSVGLAFEIGDPLTGRFISGDYAVSYLFGFERMRTSDLNQSVNIVGEFDFEKLKLGATFNYSQLSGSEREFVNGVDRQAFTLGLAATYFASEKLSVDWDVVLPFNEVDGGVGSGGLTSTEWINYHYSEKTAIGLGFGAGFLEVENSETQVFQQVLLRAVVAGSQALTYHAEAGVDFRNAGGSDNVHPIFDLGVNWTPRPGTAVLLVAQQRVQNSLLVQDVNFLSTSVILSLSQRFGSEVTGGISLGFENADFQRVGDEGGGSYDRTDKTFFGQLSVTAHLTPHSTVTGILTYRDTDSTTSSQRTIQGGMQLTYHF